MPISTLSKRLLFGTMMTLGLVGFLLGEGWLGQSFFYKFGLPNGILLGLLVAIFVAGGCLELGYFAKKHGTQPSVWIMILGSILLTMVQFYPTCQTCSPQSSSCDSWLVPILFGSFLLAGLVQGIKHRTRQALNNLAITCLGLIYLGLGGWFLVAIRLMGSSTPHKYLGPAGFLLVFLICVKSSDIGAYLIGRKLGRTPWVPSISPKKTWEGFFGGMAISLIVASLFSIIFDIMPLWLAIIFGIIMAVTGQLGDLLESMLKRDCDCKDSARLVPEFGGVLDILDSVLAAAPFAYWFLR